MNLFDVDDDLMKLLPYTPEENLEIALNPYTPPGLLEAIAGLWVGNAMSQEISLALMKNPGTPEHIKWALDLPTELKMSLGIPFRTRIHYSIKDDEDSAWLASVRVLVDWSDEELLSMLFEDGEVEAQIVDDCLYFDIVPFVAEKLGAAVVELGKGDDDWPLYDITFPVREGSDRDPVDDLIDDIKE